MMLSKVYRKKQVNNDCLYGVVSYWHASAINDTMCQLRRRTVIFQISKN